MGVNNKVRVKKTTEQFIHQANKKHNNLYDYSKVCYDGDEHKISIICRTHGEFTQRPSHHLSGKGCKKCMCDKIGNLKRKPEMLFLEQCNMIHKDFYNYNKTIYRGKLYNMIVTCPIHGDFEIRADNHHSGSGCKECFLILNRERQKMGSDEFIRRSKILHKEKYTYEGLIYSNLETKVKITCPIHGVFNQSPMVHLNNSGCPKCKCRSKGEKLISSILIDNQVEHIFQKTFDDLINPKTGHKYKFDFFIPIKNTIIEYDGIHHYKPVEYWGGMNNFIFIQEGDKLKTKYCKDNDINLIRIPYFSNVENTLRLNGII